jgi:serine/threonine-protein kinase HSL1 (negative regulator of Swe1 kinase)
MDSRGITQSRSSRTPLGDATEHIINASAHNGGKSVSSQSTAINPLRAHPVSNASRQSTAPQLNNTMPTHASVPANTRVSAVSKDDRDSEKRVSQLSNSSGASSGKRKTHIGPWQLGKTLGKGSAGRVRLARHYITQEQVAVKILPKHGCHVTQAGSLADIDKWDRTQPEFAADKRMPLSIEREVAILKLIDHPNIMKLWDIWENRSEMYNTPSLWTWFMRMD